MYETHETAAGKDYHRSIGSLPSERSQQPTGAEGGTYVRSPPLQDLTYENTERNNNNMRRTRRSSFDTAAAGGGDGGGGGGGFGFDQKRRTELLAEARRKRVAWVEEARGIDDGVDGARKRREDEAAASGRKAEGELERVSGQQEQRTNTFCNTRARERQLDHEDAYVLVALEWCRLVVMDVCVCVCVWFLRRRRCPSVRFLRMQQHRSRQQQPLRMLLG